MFFNQLKYFANKLLTMMLFFWETINKKILYLSLNLIYHLALSCLIIKKFLILLSFILTLQIFQSKSLAENNFYFEDFGLISIMYHRFNENKYPSTNIQLDVFKRQLEIIENQGIKFIHPKDFLRSTTENKNERKVLLTIDDGLLSFYQHAWPILKEKDIPFILFVSTREVGSYNYMNWDQILELHKSTNVEIGNHSHSHEYLVEKNSKTIKNDILKSINIFKEKLGKNSIFFSYPFGEYEP